MRKERQVGEEGLPPAVVATAGRSAHSYTFSICPFSRVFAAFSTYVRLIIGTALLNSPFESLLKTGYEDLIQRVSLLNITSTHICLQPSQANLRRRSRRPLPSWHPPAPSRHKLKRPPSDEKPTKVAAVVPETKDTKQADGDKKDAKPKKARQQLTSILEIDISQARCATHLKHNLSNSEIDTRIKELRKELKTAKEAKDDDETKRVKAELDGLTKKVLRLSSLAPVAAATIADYIIKELFTHGFDQAIGEDRKLLEVGHLHQGQFEDLVTYPLFRRVKAWMDFDPTREETLRKERAAANKKAKEEREAKKEAEKKSKGKDQAGKSSAKKPAAKAADAKKSAADAKKPAADAKKSATEVKKAAAADNGADSGAEDGTEESGKTTFTTYVDNALKSIRKEERYANMRVSNRIREYG